MYRRNKEEVEALQAKRHQVQADRQQIAAVIQQLDDKKRDALESTWKKVGVWVGRWGGGVGWFEGVAWVVLGGDAGLEVLWAAGCISGLNPSGGLAKPDRSAQTALLMSLARAHPLSTCCP